MISERKTTAISQLRNHQLAATNAGEYYQKSKEKGSNNTMIIDKNTYLSSRMIEQWKSLLEISDWTIECEPISEMQVVDALKGNTPGHEFVGIAIDFKRRKGTIFHTRLLLEDDIIHELLHVRFPKWSEEEVDFWTNLLMKRAGVEMTPNSTAIAVNQ